MVAYYTAGTKTRPAILTLRLTPASPVAETLTVSGKREAAAICKARNITPWNF